jgi:hypothetical protein
LILIGRKAVGEAQKKEYHAHTMAPYVTRYRTRLWNERRQRPHISTLTKLNPLLKWGKNHLNQPVSPKWRPFSMGFRMVAHRAGVQDLATNTERIMAEMMVMENWR